MLRSLYTLSMATALIAGATAANAAGYDSDWQNQSAYRNTGAVGYNDNAYSAPRVIHRVRHSTSAYTVSRRIAIEGPPCH